MAAKTVPHHMPDATGPEETIYSTADIARKFHVNQRTVRLWVSSGLLGAIRLGKLLRIRQADLDAFTGGESAISRGPKRPSGRGAALSGRRYFQISGIPRSWQRYPVVQVPAADVLAKILSWIWVASCRERRPSLCRSSSIKTT